MFDALKVKTAVSMAKIEAATWKEYIVLLDKYLSWLFY